MAEGQGCVETAADDAGRNIQVGRQSGNRHCGRSSRSGIPYPCARTRKW
jgi:hypothetical protein